MIVFTITTLAVSILAVLGIKSDSFQRKEGTFTNTPDIIISGVSWNTCSNACLSEEAWFCGGFTYRADGTCQLYRGTNVTTPCLGPTAEAPPPPLEVDTSAEPLSYQRLTQVNFISTCPGKASDPCGCPAGFSRCAGRCLAKLGRYVRYTEAEAACAKLGAHLAVPRSEQENQCARDMAAGGNTVWLGVTDREQEGQYVGADGPCGPLPASQDWWREGYPYDDGTMYRDYIVMYKGGWVDFSIIYPLNPLCQLAGCYQPQCP